MHSSDLLYPISRESCRTNGNTNLAQLGSLLKEARARSIYAEARVALDEGKRLSPTYGQLVGELKRNGFTEVADRLAAPLAALPWGQLLIEEAWETVLTLVAREVCLCGPWASQKVAQLRSQLVGTSSVWQESLDEVFAESVRSAAVWTDVLTGIVLGWTLQRREGLLSARPPSDRCEPSFAFLLRKEITDGYRQDCVNGLARRVAGMGVSSTEAQTRIQELAAAARMAPATARSNPGTSAPAATTPRETTAAPTVARNLALQRPAKTAPSNARKSNDAASGHVESATARQGRSIPADPIAGPQQSPVAAPTAAVVAPPSVGTIFRPVQSLPPAEHWTIALHLQPAVNGPEGNVESAVALVVGGVHTLPGVPHTITGAAPFGALQRFPVGVVGVARWMSAGTPGLELAARALSLALRCLPQERLTDIHVSIDWPDHHVTRDEVTALLERQCRPLLAAFFAWKRVRVAYRAVSPQQTSVVWAAAIAGLWAQSRFGDSHALQVMRECGLGQCCLYDPQELSALDAWFHAFDHPGRITGDEWISLIRASMTSGETSFPAHALLQVADSMVEDEDRPRALTEAAREFVVSPDSEPEVSQELVRWLGRHDVRFDHPALRLVQRIDQVSQEPEAGSLESAAMRGLVRLSDEVRGRFPALVAYADLTRAQLAISMYDWKGAASAVDDGLSVAGELRPQRRAALLGMRAQVEACQGKIHKAMETLSQACGELELSKGLTSGASRDVWTKRLPVWRIMAAMDQPEPSVSTISALFAQAGLPLEPVAVGAISREEDADLMELHFVTIRWIAFQMPDELVRAYVSARSEWSTGTGLQWAILSWYRGWILSARHPRAAVEAWQVALELVREVPGVGLPRMWEVVMVRTLRARGLELSIPDVQLSEGAFPAQRKALQTLLEPASSFTDRAVVLHRIATAFPFTLH